MMARRPGQGERRTFQQQEQQCKGPSGVSASQQREPTCMTEGPFTGLLLPEMCTLQTLPQGISNNGPPKEMHTIISLF